MFMQRSDEGFDLGLFLQNMDAVVAECLFELVAWRDEKGGGVGV